MGPKEFQAILEKKIPMSEVMGFQLVSLDASAARAKIPLSLNSNHRGSAFGGSLYNAIVLTCYSWLYGYFIAQNKECSLLLQEGTIKYLKEVTTDFHCLTVAPGEKEFSTFCKVFSQKGKARMDVSAFVETENQQGRCAEFTGRFVAIRGSS